MLVALESLAYVLPYILISSDGTLSSSPLPSGSRLQRLRMSMKIYLPQLSLMTVLLLSATVLGQGARHAVSWALNAPTPSPRRHQM